MDEQNFKINGTVIDFGTDGRYAPGRERALREYLEKRSDGDKVFASLVKRGAISTETQEQPEPEVQEVSTGEPIVPARGDKDVEEENATSADPAETEAQEAQAGEEMEEATEARAPDYPPSGKWEFDHYGGGNCHIINPQGYITEQVRPTTAAEEKVAALNKES